MAKTSRFCVNLLYNFPMSQHNIAIITDTTCDIPASWVEKYSIIVLPHVLIWNGVQYRDRVDLQPEEFYRRLKTEKELPTTSQASIVDFAKAYEQARESGAEEIVVLTVSSKFSGAIQSALQAAELAKLPVHVHDSKGATMSLGWQVIAAARAREAGGCAKDMLAAAEKVRSNMQLYICLDTLDYVYRGGRIGNASRMVGTMLNIKPLLYVDHSTGIVEPGGMAMTHKKGIALMVSKFFGHFDRSRPMHIAVMHGDAAKDAADLVERIRSAYNPTELISDITGPALGLNTGPGTLALAGYQE